MKKLLPILATALTLAACQEPQTPVLVKSASTVTPSPEKPKEVYQPLIRQGMEGYYTGQFGDYNKRITIRIDSIIGNRLYGQSISWGLVRPLKGELNKIGEIWKGSAAEPGDDKYDGTFHFTYNPSEENISGNWKPFNPKATGEQEFELKKKTFRYDPNLALKEDVVGPMESTYNEKTEKGEFVTEDAIKINASTTLLRSKDIENMYLADLEVLRNSIYARHGYSFKNRKMRDIFDTRVDWYIPVSADVTAALTKLEQQNIALIKRYEKHATKYYDAFGR